MSKDFVGTYFRKAICVVIDYTCVDFYVSDMGAWGNQITEKSDYMVLTPIDNDNVKLFWKLWKRAKERVKENGIYVENISGRFEIRFTGSLDNPFADRDSALQKWEDDNSGDNELKKRIEQRIERGENHGRNREN